MRPGWSPPSYLNGGDQGEEEEGEKQDIVGGEHFHQVVARFPRVWQKFCVRASSFKNLQSWPASQNTTDFLTFLIIFCLKYLGDTSFTFDRRSLYINVARNIYQNLMVFHPKAILDYSVSCKHLVTNHFQSLFPGQHLKASKLID